MNKTAIIIVSIAIIFVLGFLLFGNSRSREPARQNVEVKNGVQYIRVIAKGGYSPMFTSAKAGIPTKIVVETKDTLDCSLSLVIRSVGFQQILPKSGETEINIGIPKLGEPLKGVCGMGMYSFEVNFEA